MRGRGGRVVELECQRCHEPFEGKATNGKWCPECLPIVTREQGQRRMRERRALDAEIKKLDNTYDCPADVLVYIMRLMYEDCPGGEVEDCSTCIFNRPFFCGCCDKMSPHPYGVV